MGSLKVCIYCEIEGSDSPEMRIKTRDAIQGSLPVAWLVGDDDDEENCFVKIRQVVITHDDYLT